MLTFIGPIITQTEGGRKERRIRPLLAGCPSHILPPLAAGGPPLMKVYNAVGYSLMIVHVITAGLATPAPWGFVVGAMVGFVYLLFIWFLGGLYLSDVMHMGIAHKTLDYKSWFIKAVVIVHSVAGIYINPTTWVNRHRHHHAFSDHDGDPNKLHEDGFFRTMYLCIFPYKCKSNLAKDPIFRSWPLRLTSARYFCLVSQVTSFALLFVITRSW